MNLINTMFTLLKLKYHCVLMISLVVAVRMSDLSPCKPNFQYHAFTQTCMQLINQSSSYDNSKDHCKRLKGGPNNNTGHLVYIFDNETDTFVRNLLPNEQVTAYIGLNNFWDGYKYIYRWGDTTKPADYFRWQGVSPTQWGSYGVIISKNGWKQGTAKTFFICEVDAEIQLPTIFMTCPPLLMGQTNPEIQCVIGKGLSFGRSQFRINNVRALCNTTGCVATEGYAVSVQDTGPSLSMTLNIMSAKRSDEGLLRCEWEFVGFSSKLSTSCNITVYDPPTGPPELVKLPSQEFYNEGDNISITCTVHGGSPPVISTTIFCDREILLPSREDKPVTTSGNTVTINVTLNMDMNGKSCNCSGQHESRLYLLQSSLTFSVRSSAKVTLLTFANAVLNGKDYEAETNRELRITCSASGNPTPSLSLYYTDTTQHALSTVIGYQLIYSIKTSCNDSGRYLCVASNMDNATSSTLARNLKVKCTPTLCPTEKINPKYGVTLNKDATVEMCTYAYPKPQGLFLYKDPKFVSSNKYSVKFNYTDEVKCRGLLSLKLNDVRREDMGHYLFVMDRQYLQITFSFVPQGPPECPREVEVKDVFSNMITIAWKPGNDGGLQQTFILLRRDIMKEVGRVQDTKNSLMEYNLTGLSAMTSYVLSIDVVNEQGRTNCTNINITATTNATSSSQEIEPNVSPATYIIPLVILLLLVLCGVLVVIVARRRKRKNQDIKKMFLLEEVKTRPPKLDESKEKEEEKNLHTSIYNSATLDTTEPKNKIKPIVRKPKRDSSKSKPSSVKDADSKGDDAGTEGDTYTQVLKVNKRTEKNDEVTENVYNNQLEIVNQMGDTSSAVPHRSASDLPKNMAYENNDDTVEYANTNNISSNPEILNSGTTPESNTAPTETKKPSRTVSPEGLVYVSVEISAATKNPVIKEKKVDEPHDEVEYMSIDHLATSESRLVVEDGRDEDGDSRD